MILIATNNYTATITNSCDDSTRNYIEKYDSTLSTKVDDKRNPLPVSKVGWFVTTIRKYNSIKY